MHWGMWDLFNAQCTQCEDNHVVFCPTLVVHCADRCLVPQAAFHELRTQQQLGYIVFLSTWANLTVRSVAFILQSTGMFLLLLLISFSMVLLLSLFHPCSLASSSLRLVPSLRLGEHRVPGTLQGQAFAGHSLTHRHHVLLSSLYNVFILCHPSDV